MINIPPYILKVLNNLNNNGFEGYLVGGCVRDALMGKTAHDFDITTNALPKEIISCFKGMKIIETGLKHGTVTVVSDGENVEITTYRIDGKYTDNRHPENVSFTRNIHEDLSRRDFTVNAIAYSPHDGFVDAFGGQEDIKKSIIRCVGCPDTRFSEDGLRIMRAIRFSSVLSFDIDNDTSLRIHKNKNILTHISAERIYSELKKLLSGNNVSNVLKEYYDVLCVIFPVFKKYCELYYSNLAMVPLSPNDSISRMCTLFYGMNTDDIKTSIKLLKPDNYLYENVLMLSKYLVSDINLDKTSIRYIMNKLSDENIIRLSKIKKLFSSGFMADEFINQYNNQVKACACVHIKDLKIKGDEIINLGVKKGPKIGEIMNKLLHAVIEDKCSNDNQSLKKYIISSIINQ